MTERELRALAAYVDLPEERDLAPAVRARLRGRPARRGWARRRVRSGARRGGGGVRGPAGALGDPSLLPSPGGDDRARRRAAAGATADDARPRHPDRSGRRRAHRRLPAARVEPARAARRGHLGRRPALVPVRPRSAARLPGCRARSGAISSRRSTSPGRLIHGVDVDGEQGYFLTRRAAPRLPRPERSLSARSGCGSPQTCCVWQHGPLLMRIEGRFTEAEALRIARSFRAPRERDGAADGRPVLASRPEPWPGLCGLNVAGLRIRESPRRGRSDWASAPNLRIHDDDER